MKRVLIESFDVAVFSAFFTRISEAFSKEVVPHLNPNQWLNLLAYDDFAFCRQLVSNPNVAVTLNKLRGLLGYHFTSSDSSCLL